MGAASSASSGPADAPDFTLDIALKETIPVREVLAAVQATGKAIAEVYSSQAQSPLAQAGAAARSVLLAELARAAPHVPVITRGCVMTPTATRGKLSSFWLVDPVGSSEDSPSAAPAGRDDLSVSVALVHNGTVVVGVVHSVASGETAWAVQDNGAWLLKPDGSQKRLECGQFSLSDTGLKIVLPARGKEADELAGFFGGAEVLQVASGPLGLLKVASGAAQVYAGFSPLSEWEVAAADVIIREAGGAMLQAGAATEDWKEAVIKELPVVYNSSELRAPRLLAFGRRRVDDESVISSFINNAFGSRKAW